LPVKSNICILDLGTGEAFFAIEVANLFPDVKIVGIDISKNSIRDAKKNLKRENLKENIEIKMMDATGMSFKDQEFDMVINFTGLEDIHMTRGKVGVEKTFFEVNRVLKPQSYFCHVIMPPDQMETQAQKIEVALFSYICDATWLNLKEYEKLLERSKFRLISRKIYYTGKKLTSEQAKREIIFACKEAPKIYSIKARSFDETWDRFGKDIEKYGLGHYSRVVLQVAKKIGEFQ